MKRSVALAIGVLALTAVAEPLFAAESETAAPVERERAAPSARRAQPARTQQRAAPQRQAPQQQASQTSSYTGTQAGGFGGGNAGGGGFADPGLGACQVGSFSGLSNQCNPRGNLNQPLGGGGKGNVGTVLETTLLAAPFARTAFGDMTFIVRLLGDLSFGKTTATTTQTSTYASSPFSSGALTTETYNNSVNQGTSGSARLKVGLVVPVAGLWGSVMPYFTIGWIRSRFDGNFSYVSSSYSSPSCAFNPSCSVMQVSAVNWSKSQNGVVTGAGVEIPIGFGPGIVLVADYTYANFGSFDVPLTFNVAAPTPCVPSPGVACTAGDVAHLSNLATHRFNVGAKFKLF